MSLADEVLAEHKAVPVMNGERCGECEARFPCLPVRLATKLKAAEHVVEAAKKLQRDYEDEVPADFAAGNLGHRVRAELAQTQDIAIDYAELYEATTNTTPVASQDARSAEKVDQHAALLDERRYADLMTRSAEQKKSPD